MLCILGMVAHIFNSSTRKAEVSRYQSSRPACLLYVVCCNLDNQMDIERLFQSSPPPKKKCMGVLPACMNVHPVGAVPKEARRECWNLWNWITVCAKN